jgi:methionine biosynthesis protein MetW
MGTSVERFQNSQWQKLGRLNFSKSTILELIERGTVLDIGCGDGILLENLNKKGINGRGIDISSEAIKICKERGLQCEQSDITDKLPFADNSFDGVVLTDVLEHLFQPLDVLNEAHRVCKEYVYISVPNFVSFPARIHVLFGTVPENNTPRDGHVYWMTKKVLLDLLNRSSFEIEKIIVNTFWENIPVIGYFMKVIKNIFPSFFALSFIIKANKI